MSSGVDQQGARAAFDAWVASLPSTRALAPRTITGYDQIWTPWLRFLAGRRKRWDEARADDFGAFLDSLQTPRPAEPRRSSTAPQGGPAAAKVSVRPKRPKDKATEPKLKKPASHVTLRRYWRVVGEIYSYAVRTGTLSANPVCTANRPSKGEAAASVAIYPYFLRRLRKRLPTGDDVLSKRDRALIAVLADVGLTTHELIDLEPEGVSTSTAHDGFVLSITGDRKAQDREVYLGADASRELAQWLDARDGLDNPVDRVFVSMRGKGKLAPTDVLNVVSTWLCDAAKRVQLPVVKHMGSNSLRTAVLIWWRDVDKLSTEELLARAGLAEAQALRRLPEPLPTPFAKPPIIEP